MGNFSKDFYVDLPNHKSLGGSRYPYPISGTVSGHGTRRTGDRPDGTRAVAGTTSRRDVPMRRQQRRRRKPGDDLSMPGIAINFLLPSRGLHRKPWSQNL